MKKIKKIERISSFYPEKNNVFLGGLGHYNLLDEKFNTIYSIGNIRDFQVTFFENDLIIFINGESHLKIYRSGKLIFEKEHFDFENKVEGNFIFYDRVSKKTVIVDLEGNTILSEANIRIGSKRVLFDKQIITTPLFESSGLTSYLLPNFTPLWQYTLPEGVYDYEDKFGTKYKSEIQRIIGQYEGVLWVALENGYLLGLSVDDGSLVHELSVPNNFTEYFPNEKPRFGANYTQLDEKEGKLFGMRLNYYWEINLQNPANEYILYDISATCKEKQVVINYVEYETWLQDEIIFREWSFAQDPSYVGIFNRKTRQITWASRELGEEGVFKGINKVEYQAGRLYVLDRASTLHIFEREDAQ
jgi:hypothetical protein